jgi:hypothetical protein
MHVPINVKSPNNIIKWQMGFNSAFKGLSTHSSPNCALLRPVRQSVVSSCCLHNRHLPSVSPFNVVFLKQSVLLALELPLLYSMFLHIADRGVEKITQ